MEKKSDEPERLFPGPYPQPIKNAKHPAERVFLDLYRKPKDRNPLSFNTEMIQGGEEPRAWANPPTSDKEWYASIHLPVKMTHETLRHFLPAIFKLIKTVRESDPLAAGPKAKVDAASRRRAMRLRKMRFCVFCDRGKHPFIDQKKDGVAHVMTIATMHREGQEAFGRIKGDLKSQHIKRGMAASSKKPGGRKRRVTRQLWQQIRKEYLRTKGEAPEVRKSDLLMWYEGTQRPGSRLKDLQANTLLWYGQHKRFPAHKPTPKV